MFVLLILSISKVKESGGLQPHLPAPEYPYLGGEAIFSGCNLQRVHHIGRVKISLN